MEEASAAAPLKEALGPAAAIDYGVSCEVLLATYLHKSGQGEEAAGSKARAQALSSQHAFPLSALAGWA